MGEKICLNCKKAPVGVGRVRYCDECAVKVKNQLRREADVRRYWGARGKRKTVCEWCGEKPIAPHRKRYCDECARMVDVMKERERKRIRAQMQKAQRAINRAQREAEKAAAPDVVQCKGCVYYKNLGANGSKACHYAIETDVLRKIPAVDCYKHEGTPYTPKKPKA